MMITRLTGVSQAGRLRCCGAGAPPWDPSAEVLASVSLTAGLSLNLFRYFSHPRTACSATSDAGRSPACRGRWPIARPKADRTGQGGHNGRVLRNLQVKACGKTLTPGQLACATAPWRTAAGEPLPSQRG